MSLEGEKRSFLISRKPNVQMLALLAICSSAWAGPVILGLVIPSSSLFLSDCCFCPCRLEASSPGALRSGIQVGCWTTSWPPSCTALAAWPTSRVLGACPTSSTILSLGPRMVSMRAWPSAGTGDQLGPGVPPILLVAAEFLAH